MKSPQNSHEAADQLSALAKELRDARHLAEKHGNLRDSFGALYRRETARAGMHDEVIALKSEDRRKNAIYQWRTTPEVRKQGAKLAETMGLDGMRPDTVGDLEWLRDRAASLAESHSAKAYDARALVQGWLVVASMAKFELSEVGDRSAA